MILKILSACEQLGDRITDILFAYEQRTNIRMNEIKIIIEIFQRTCVWHLIFFLNKIEVFPLECFLVVQDLYYK